MAEAGSTERLKVFISYSRRDSGEFAEELLVGLELAAFAPFLDRHDIAPGEPWEERLGGLIQQAGTVVYVISPEAVKSERCEWEVDKAIALSKRIIPVVYKQVADNGIPEQLRRRQYVRFDSGPGITRPLAQLADALRQDLDWIREHTRLGELADRWEARGRPELLLLRGDELEAAQTWAGSRKPDAPAITDSMRAFVAASGRAEKAYLAKADATKRRVRWTETFATVCIVVVILTLVGWRNQNWLKERMYVLINVHALTAAQEEALKAGDTFKECTDCPDMSVVPAGSFMMGSPAGEGNENEHPRHKVTVTRPFAVSKYELTFAEWDACVAQGDCPSGIGDGGYGRGRQPVINVSWDDAQTYVGWLVRITRNRYRLLSEAEYEYAARAGTTTAYPWGEDIGMNNAPCQFCLSARGGPSSVGSFPPNRFGLYDMVGNVIEWVEDCYHRDYDGAPADGSAWACQGDDQGRVVRGSSWYKNPDYGYLRSAYRFVGLRYSRNATGFRVARTLDVR